MISHFTYIANTKKGFLHFLGLFLLLLIFKVLPLHKRKRSAKITL